MRALPGPFLPVLFLGKSMSRARLTSELLPHTYPMWSMSVDEIIRRFEGLLRSRDSFQGVFGVAVFVSRAALDLDDVRRLESAGLALIEVPAELIGAPATRIGRYVAAEVHAAGVVLCDCKSLLRRNGEANVVTQL